MPQSIEVLILAAGSASRFGSPKQLISHHGKPLLQHCIDKANAICPGRVSVVLGANREQIEPLISGVRVIYNNQWQQGLGASIAAGVKSIDWSSEALLIILADQIALTTNDLKRLLQAFDGTNTVSSYYAGRRGVPAIFPQSLYADLKELSGDNGAKVLLQRGDIKLVEVDLPQAAMDIDTPEDWADFLDSLD